MLPRLAIALFALFFNYQASADELLMKNGSLLVGTLVSASDSTVVFDTPFAGEITLKQENIERITTTESVTLLMDDERVYRDKRITEQDGELTVLDKDEQPVTLDLATVAFGRSTRRWNQNAVTVIPMNWTWI
jgi:hypothetical protein